ncbi:MAG TPA: 50S ribosomal protein L9 [Gaiellaceae bacterium]|jgi:large subunit ribosomal protein L9|nr:50S ribosomal protein L9 [Gaiellaceae bacterium]
MQVILLEDVDKLGLRGEVVDVARGYARNFLLPRKLAETATPGALQELGRRDEVRARQEASSHDEAREIATRLEAAPLRFDVKAGPTGTLFGSVTATDIADRLWDDHKIRIDRRKVALGDSIKRVGRHEVPVEVFTDVEATLRLEVVPEGGIEEMEAMEAAARAEEEAAAAAAAEAAGTAAEPEGAIEVEALIEQTDALEAEEAGEAEERPGEPEPEAHADGDEPPAEGDEPPAEQ